MIDGYSFGRIVVNGKTYTNDIKIFNNIIKPDWWRKEGHKLYLEDMRDVLAEKPKIIIIGCGHDGVMKVMPEVHEYCQKNKIELIELWTTEAVKKFNELAGPGVIGLFHLTC
ncbi:Mth938-like domain-containing protein [Candidatus Micrarchaeota archaeon]|nr:Mth938-like domain-containing protein [Candidatus Micrarchaeota archaeon]